MRERCFGGLDRISIEIGEWCCEEFCWRREACEDTVDGCDIWYLIRRNIWEYGDSEYGDYGDGVQTVVFSTYLIGTLFL